MSEQHSLTSSISSRETLLLSLLDIDTEPESATGASTALFCWSLWESCETWVVCCISDVLCESCITFMQSAFNKISWRIREINISNTFIWQAKFLHSLFILFYTTRITFISQFLWSSFILSYLFYTTRTNFISQAIKGYNKL